MASELIEARDVMNARYMEENGIEPTASVRIPRMDCCGRLVWDCECPHTCEDCGETLRGQGSCPWCAGA